MSALTAAQLAGFKQQLEKRAEAIEEALQTARERSRTVELDQQSTGRVSRGDALQQQAMAAANVVQYEQQLRGIRRALHRIGSGDFGCCRECDEPIALKRLQARPEVSLCLECQALAERRGD
ncbi:TraR/DksA family transcriptional regulator [Marinobacteraceae bacterium S3BR75-40.1]